MSPDDIPPEAPAPAAPAALADALRQCKDALIAALDETTNPPQHLESTLDAMRDALDAARDALDGQPQQSAITEGMLDRFAAALEGECDGLDIGRKCARAVLRYTLTGEPPEQEAQESAREPTDEELADLWPRFHWYGPTGMRERGRAPLPPGALEFARAVRAWKPEESDRD